MKLALENLLERGQIESFDASEEDILRKVEIAKRDIQSAENMIKMGDFDWSLSASYNAMLQSSVALMFREGYRPKGDFESKHVATIEFLKTEFKNPITLSLISILNRIRIRRHVTIYDEAGTVSKEEAESALSTAREFTNRVLDLLSKK